MCGGFQAPDILQSSVSSPDIMKCKSERCLVMGREIKLQHEKVKQAFMDLKSIGPA